MPNLKSFKKATNVDKVIWSRQVEQLGSMGRKWKLGKYAERLGAALCDGLLKKSKPYEAQTGLSSPQLLSYSVEEGAFQSIEEAQKIYELVKKECQPTNAKEMASFWQAEIRNRKASLGVSQLGSV